MTPNTNESQHFDLLIRGGTAVLPDSVDAADIGIRNGKIVAVGTLSTDQADNIVDAGGLHVLPGIIDTQVHFREPGFSQKEDLESGTAAAALGGVTAIFEMPNTRPPTTCAESLQEKLSRAEGRAWVDHAFFMGPDTANMEKLSRLERLPGCAGVKMFMGASTGSLLICEDDQLEAVVAHGVRRMAVHSEHNERLVERKPIAVAAGRPHAHPEWRDVQTGVISTKRLLAVARRHNRRIHVLHVTTAEEMEILAENRDLATVEVTPQHLTLAAPDCYDRLGTLAQMNPPIREQRHQDALWKALQNGIVDLIGSDHAPHTREEKARPYPYSPSGLPGVQTMLPLMLNHMNQGRLSLRKLVNLMSANAARVYGVDGKGSIAIGMDADFTLVDLKAEREITHDQMRSRVGWTPFHGMKVTGWPMATIIRGQMVMQDGELLGTPIGIPVRFVMPDIEN